MSHHGRLRRTTICLITAALTLIAGCQIAGRPIAAESMTPPSGGPVSGVPSETDTGYPLGSDQELPGSIAAGPIAEALPENLAPPSPGWLVLAYQAAGNDLEAAILDDVYEASSTRDPGVRVLSLLDRSPHSDESRGYTAADSLPGIPEGSGTQLITMVAGQAQLIADLPDLPMSNAQTLAAFVAAGIRAFPTAKVALVIADHGAGWVGAAVDEVAAETGAPRLLDLPTIVDGIAAGLRQAGRSTLDLIGFDACLMAEWDVAMALAPLSDRLLASAETEPNAGWDWTFLERANAADSADELAGHVVSAYGDYYATTPQGQQSTISLVDLTRMDQLDIALGYLSAVTVVGGTDDELAWLARARASAWEYGRSPDPASDARLVDLGSWATVLTHGGGALGDAAQQLLEALDATVVTQWAGEAVRHSSGLSVYLPPSADTADPSYMALGGGSLWSQFLADFHGRIARMDIPTDFVGLTALDVSTGNDGTFAASARFNPGVRGLVVGGALRLGAVLADGSIAYLRSSPIEVGDDTATGWDEFAFFHVSDGAIDLPVYLDQERATGIPFWYSGGDGAPIPVIVQLADAGNGTLSAAGATAVLPGSTTASRAVLDPNGILRPRFRTAGADGSDSGWTDSESLGDVSADLSRHVYRFGTIPAGSNVAVEVSLLLANGAESSVTTVVEVP